MRRPSGRPGRWHYRARRGAHGSPDAVLPNSDTIGTAGSAAPRRSRRLPHFARQACGIGGAVNGHGGRDSCDVDWHRVLRAEATQAEALVQQIR